MSKLKPFKINVPPAQLDDLKMRLEKTILPGEVKNVGWNYGPTEHYIAGLIAELKTSYDWRKHEARINQYLQFTTEIDEQTIHFIHVKSAEKKATPLMLVHGWPGSIVEFL